MSTCPGRLAPPPFAQSESGQVGVHDLVRVVYLAVPDQMHNRYHPTQRTVRSAPGFRAPGDSRCEHSVNAARESSTLSNILATSWSLNIVVARVRLWATQCSGLAYTAWRWTRTGAASMPLNEREQQILDEIERQFQAEDPEFTKRTSSLNRIPQWYLRVAVAGVVIGSLVLLVTFSFNTVLAVGGFCVLLLSTATLIRILRLTTRVPGQPMRDFLPNGRNSRWPFGR
ncbi:MAG: DUF3040 domain-containing protein [Acidimicrobiia bacterium]|nr:DUF3040 domain-containing protein [Acidimicrobiia bacterium]MYF84001.1 DUF3040 domain-containing protein [Acidimicrobiia bacterium]